MINLEKLLRVPSVDGNNGFDISPDGQSLAFSWNKSGQWELYELPLSASTGALRAPIPLALGNGREYTGAKFTPKYSPDGFRLAYMVDFDGSEDFHLFVYDLATGTHRDLTPRSEKKFSLQPNFCWSPDGQEIAFISNQGGNFDAYVAPSTGGAARCVFANQRPAWDAHWSPDGAWLAVTFESRGQDYGIQLVSMENGASFPLTSQNGVLNAHNPCWAPDSAAIAFHSDALNGWHQIGIFEIHSRQITWLTSETCNHYTPCWSKDGKTLAYIRASGATDQVVIHPMDGQSASFQVDAGAHSKPRFTPDGRRVIILFNNPRFPPDLWELTLASGELVQLTHSLPDEMEEESFILPQEIMYPGLDGAPIPALLFKAEQAGDNTPAAVVIHGGPNWHYQMEWYPLMIHLASRGWTVLAPNYRGSTGYGRAWQYANQYDLGGVDTDDVAAGAQYLILERLADPEKIVVTGRSHGGYLTMTCLTQYPDLWAAGSGVVPFMNWFTCHERSRGDLKHWDIEMMGNPSENHALWHERSPYFFLDQILAPVQLICGEHDPRCPAEDSMQTRDKLIELGKQVDFRLYAGEGHSFLKIENVVDSETRRVEFLASAMEGTPIPMPDREDQS